MVIYKLLEQIPFFWNFTPEEKERIVEGDSFFESFEEGDYLIHEGAEDATLFIIIKGSVIVTKNSHPDRIMTTLGAGTVMGELAFLSQRPRSTNVIAEEKTVCFVMDNSTMESMDPVFQLRIKNQLIEILIRRLDEVNTTLMAMVR